MSIRLIAKELYRLINEVEKLEKQIQNTPYENRGKSENQLRKLKAERNRSAGCWTETKTDRGI